MRSRRSASDLVKIKNRSRKRSHKLDGIGVRRIRTVPLIFFSDSSENQIVGLVEQKQKRKNQPITMPGLSFGFRLRLQQSSYHWIISIGVISGIGGKWNRSDSAYDSDFQFSLGRKRSYVSDYNSNSDIRHQWKPALNSKTWNGGKSENLEKRRNTERLRPMGVDSGNKGTWP